MCVPGTDRGLCIKREKEREKERVREETGGYWICRERGLNEGTGLPSFFCNSLSSALFIALAKAPQERLAREREREREREIERET